MLRHGATAVFLPNWIGDVVMATPALQALHQITSAQPLIAVGKSYVAEVVAGAPWFEHYLPFDRRGLRGTLDLIKALRNYQVQNAILFPNSLRPALIARLAGCAVIAGFARYGRDILLTHRLYPRRGQDGQPLPYPILLDYNALLARLGTKAPGLAMKLYTTADDEARAQALWSRWQIDDQDMTLGFNSGGAYGAAKHWPIEHFVALGHRLLRTHSRRRLIIFCGPNERDRARAIAQGLALEASRVHSLDQEEVSLGLTKALIRRLSLLVSTDSGPRHFAPAFNVPVVSLFGPTFIDWTRTFTATEIMLQKQVPCGPCQQRTCPLDHRCMTQLLPNEVDEAIQKLLNGVMGR